MNADTEPKKIRNWFDQSQWADAVRNAAFEAGCSRILIDGDPGAGKTTLAHNIASDLGFKVISFDDDKYLAGNGTRYIEQLDLEALRNDVLASDTKLVIDGVLALKVLTKLGARHDYHIFMKRYDGDIGWVFGQYLGEKTKPPCDPFWQEIVQYYKEFKPFDVCNLVLSRDILSCNACPTVETK